VEARDAAGLPLTVDVHTIGIDGRAQRTEHFDRPAS
jgi:hypothetical protein